MKWPASYRPPPPRGLGLATATTSATLSRSSSAVDCQIGPHQRLTELDRKKSSAPLTLTEIAGCALGSVWTRRRIVRVLPWVIALVCAGACSENDSGWKGGLQMTVNWSHYTDATATCRRIAA